jgi:hypothetical protein
MRSVEPTPFTPGDRHGVHQRPDLGKINFSPICPGLSRRLNKFRLGSYDHRARTAGNPLGMRPNEPTFEKSEDRRTA